MLWRILYFLFPFIVVWGHSYSATSNDGKFHVFLWTYKDDADYIDKYVLFCSSCGLYKRVKVKLGDTDETFANDMDTLDSHIC